jgi:cephalosporin-C deacetylase-like acetyl esterase
MTENYIAAAAQAHLNRRREKIATINSAQAVTARQAQIRDIVASTLGAFPERSPLKTRLIVQLPHEGYRIDSLTYESIPGVVVTANLYVPGDSDGPYPAVICIPPYTVQGKANAECQRLCQLLARRGIASLVIDLPGMGERLEFYDSTLRRSFTGKLVAAEHAHLGNVLLLTGHNLTNWMVSDAIRGLDALVELKMADPAKLGVIGCGGGAALARLLCCVDPRVSAAATVADHFDAEWAEGSDEDHLHYSALEHGVTALDTLAAFAPRPLLISQCSQDRFKGNVPAHTEELSKFYALLNAKDNLSTFEADGSSGYLKLIRARATEHFARAFALPEERVREPETPPETPETLYCTETGQVSNSLNATSLFAWHKDISREVPPSLAVPRDADAAVNLQSEIRDRFVPFLKLPEPAKPVESQIESRSVDWGFAVEKGRLVLAEGLFAPYSFYSLPESADAGKKTAPVVLVLHERGIAAVSSQGAWMNGFAAAGFHVMAIDVSGIGETRLQPKGEENDAYQTLLCGPESQWARRALHAGLSLFGLRVYNVLRTLEFLRTRWDVDKEHIAIAGVGRGALWGLYASALDGGISHTVLLRGLDSYRSLIERRHHNHHFSIYLPGCLKEYDLPHVSACIAPRPLTIVNPVNSRKERMEAENVTREYALTAAIYKLRGAASNLRIINTDSAPETFAAVRDGIVNDMKPES